MSRYGLLAALYLGRQLPLKILRANNEFYIGTEDEDGPCSRESQEYWPTWGAAEAALAGGQWTQKESP